MLVGQIKLGMHVRRADGTYGVVTGWKVVPGTQVMYNLEVAQDHTFTVGTGQWVVHNCGGLDASLAKGREAWSIEPRSLNPDDRQTFAQLFVDGDQYWGVNGEKPISFSVNAISSSHAEIDALDQLARDRAITGISGGDALMLVDRVPCKACYANGGLGSAVRAAGLDSLVIYNGPSLDNEGNFVPPGVLEVLP